MGLFKRKPPTIPDAPKGHHWKVEKGRARYGAYVYEVQLVVSKTGYQVDHRSFYQLGDREIADAAQALLNSIEYTERIEAARIANEAKYLGTYPPKTIPSKEAN